jgi:hypothetical protein
MSLPDIKDVHDVIHFLEEHSEWIPDLRRVLLTNDLLALPEQVTRLTEQVGKVSTEMHALVEAQRQTTTQLATLTEVVQRMGVDVGRLKGDDLEVRYFLKSLPSVTRLIRRPHTLSPEELDSLLEDAETRGLISADEGEDIALADLVIRGRGRDSGAAMYLLTEVSWGVGIDDVERAARRALLLTKTGVTAIPAVAGEWVTPEAQQLASSKGVWQFVRGRVVSPSL